MVASTGRSARRGEEHEVAAVQDEVQTGSEFVLQDTPITGFLYLLVAFATIGAILFGLDQGNWAGAIEKPDFIEAFCRPDPAHPDKDCQAEEASLKPPTYTTFLSLGSSLVQLGAFFGAVILAPPITGRMGRREAMFIGCLITIVGVVPMCLFIEPLFFEAARFIAGVGVGIVTYALPMFIAEVSPMQIRGTLTSAFQLLMVLGMIIAALLNTQTWFGYRLSFSLPGYPALIMCLGIFCFPVSPRFALIKGMREGKPEKGSKRAYDALLKLRGSKKAAQQELAYIKECMAAEDDEAPWSTLVRDPSILRRVLIASGLQWMQQFTGINALLSYGPSMLKEAHLQMDAEVAQFIINCFNLVGTATSMAVIDKFGRRPLMLFGSSMMCVFMIASGFIAMQMEKQSGHVGHTAIAGKIEPIFANETGVTNVTNVTGRLLASAVAAVVNETGAVGAAAGASSLEEASPEGGLGIALMVCLCGYILAFGVGWGGVPWVYPSEIFPMDVKEKAMSISVGSQWLANFLIAFLVPQQVSLLSLDGTFFFYAVCLVIIFAVVFFFVPETKGIAIEEMDNLFGARLGNESGSGDESGEPSSEESDDQDGAA